MTKREKLKEITSRLKEINVEIDTDMISCLVISKYCADFMKKNIIEGELIVSENGLKVVSLCEEFDWKPTNKEIKEYVDGLVSTEDNEKLIEMLIEYRDDSVGFMEKVDASSK